MTVYERDYWWSDAWDPLSFGQEYDFSKPFFQQFNEFIKHIPMPSVFNQRTVNCDYTNHIGEMKDCYLTSAGWNGENNLYCSRINRSKDIIDAYAIGDCSFCYDITSSIKLSGAHFSYKCENCTDSFFLFDCRGCSHCFGCVNLRNQSYRIFNQPYSKIEYFKKIEEFNIGSYAGLEKVKKQYNSAVTSALHKYATILNSRACTGDNISHAADCKECFDVSDNARDSKFIINGGFTMNDSYDGYGVGVNSSLLYESFDTGAQGERFFFCGVVWAGHNVQYSFNCHGCENCFACIGLRKKSYCIFNKQYSKEEYETLLSKIIQHMNNMPYKDRNGHEYRYGEFFPIELSPFAYNETVAQDYFPLNENQSVAKGYAWRKIEQSKYTITLMWQNIPDHIDDAHDGILKEVIDCKDCRRAFRIIKRELDFLKKYHIALPRKCFECRHLDRFKQVNFPRLYHRTCMCLSREVPKERNGTQYQNTIPHFHGDQPCPNEFETTYVPNRPETIYCEACYNAEVV